MIRTITIHTTRQGLHEITVAISEAVRALLGELAARGGGVSRKVDGLCTIYLQHTSASLTIQENASSSARRDLEVWLNRLVPENDSLYTHTAEGPDDMPSHIKAILTSVSLSVPIVNGELALGQWQGIYLWEHRRQPHTRRVLIHVQ